MLNKAQLNKAQKYKIACDWQNLSFLKESEGLDERDQGNSSSHRTGRVLKWHNH